MTNNELDDDRTIETGKLVFGGQTYQKAVSYFFIVLMVCMAVGISYGIFKTQLQNQPRAIDYFVAVFFPVLLMIFFRKRHTRAPDKRQIGGIRNQHR